MRPFHCISGALNGWLYGSGICCFGHDTSKRMTSDRITPAGRMGLQDCSGRTEAARDDPAFGM
jgi:hypothetical protein